MPAVAPAADSGAAAPFTANRVERDQRQFGNVRFIMGSGQAMTWLEMYVGRDLIAAFRDFDVQDVHASPDGNYFLAISNKAGSSYAYAVLDRGGRLVFSSPHRGGAISYCSRGAQSNWYWVDAARPQARFEVESIQGAAEQQFLRAVTVAGCDGKDVLLGKAEQPRAPGASGSPQPSRVAANIPGPRPSFFIGNTIANLRGLDPTFGGRTLTLIDGRRTLQPPRKEEPVEAATPAAATPEAEKDQRTGQ